MASGLRIDRDSLRSLTGRYLGFTDTSSNWSTGQSAIIDESVNSGLRQFYWPPLTPVSPQGYEWSFLNSVAVLPTVNGTKDYLMPDDIYGIDGDITYDEDTGYARIRMVGEVQIRRLRARFGESSGVPYFGALRSVAIHGESWKSGSDGVIGADPKDLTAASVADWTNLSADVYTAVIVITGGTGTIVNGTYAVDTLTAAKATLKESTLGTASDTCSWDLRRLAGVSTQKFELMVYPTPDAVYNLNYRYRLLPDALFTYATFPLGALPHAETIYESCLAIAEQRFDDSASTIHQQRFMERLQASIVTDMRQSRADYFGRMGDTQPVRILSPRVFTARYEGQPV